MRRLRSALVVGALAALASAATPGILHAQGPRVAPERVRDDSARARPVPSAPLVALLSGAAPGAGQYLLRLDRWVPIAAAELFGWWEAARQSRTANGLERRYRDIAWDVARRVSVGERRDTAFEYYELMTKPLYNASGRFDTDASTPGVEPETRAGTYNAYIWEQAKALKLGGAPPIPGTSAYNGALRWYQDNAIPAAYAWDWGSRYLEQQVYVDVFHRADDAFRHRDRTLALILANHVASAVDAFVAARLRAASGLRVEEVRSGFVPEGAGVRWQALVRIGWPVDGI